MLGGETDKITFVRIKNKIRTSSKKNTVECNVLVQQKGTHCDVGVLIFMAVFFSQWDVACF